MLFDMSNHHISQLWSSKKVSKISNMNQPEAPMQGRFRSSLICLISVQDLHQLFAAGLRGPIDFLWTSHFLEPLVRENFLCTKKQINIYINIYIYIHIYFTMSAMSSHGSWVMMLKHTFFSKKSHSPPGIPWTETSNSSRRATSWSDDIRWVAKPHANASRPQDARTASQCENTPKTGCQPSNSDTSPRNMGEYSWRIKCTPESAELWWYGHFLKSSELRNAIHQPELDQKKCVWDSKLVGVFTPPKQSYRFI